MSEEKERMSLANKQAEAGDALWKGDFCIDIDDIEIEFEGQTPRLTGRIEINLEAREQDQGIPHITRVIAEVDKGNL